MKETTGAGYTVGCATNAWTEVERGAICVGGGWVSRPEHCCSSTIFYRDI